jgi:Mg-chelatase subunit ChlD
MNVHGFRLLLASLVVTISCNSKVGQVGGADSSVPSGTRADGSQADIPTFPINLDVANAAIDGNVGAEASICSTIQLTPEAIYPEVMIAQDISGSMDGTRWTNTKAALVDLASTLDNRLRLGIYFFPKLQAPASNSCQLPTFPAGQYVDVAPALGNGPNIKAALNQLDSHRPYGGTPTAEALPIIRDYFLHHSTAPVGTPKYVILVTDGSPNCTPPSGDGDNANDPVSQAATTTEIQNLRSDGMITYVVGYEISTTLQSVMNKWAVAGGGFDQYINVTNQQSLSTALAKIANVIVPCEYELDTTPSDPSFVRVQLDGQALKFNDQNGWALTANRLVLQGAACSLLRDGQQHALHVQVECEPVVIP